MIQMKEQDKIPEEELGEMEISNLPKKEFRVVTRKTVKELGRRMDAQSETLEILNKELENTKNNEAEMKNTITELKKYKERNKRRLNHTEEWISELEDRVVEITDAKLKKEKKKT